MSPSFDVSLKRETRRGRGKRGREDGRREAGYPPSSRSPTSLPPPAILPVPTIPIPRSFSPYYTSFPRSSFSTSAASLSIPLSGALFRSPLCYPCTPRPIIPSPHHSLSRAFPLAFPLLLFPLTAPSLLLPTRVRGTGTSPGPVCSEHPTSCTTIGLQILKGIKATQLADFCDAFHFLLPLRG